MRDFLISLLLIFTVFIEQDLNITNKILDKIAIKINNLNSILENKNEQTNRHH